MFVSLNIACIEIKAEDVMQTVNQLLLERKTGERLRLSQHFTKIIIDVPDKMKRVDIINAPLFFKNRMDDYRLISKYMSNNIQKKIKENVMPISPYVEMLLLMVVIDYGNHIKYKDLVKDLIQMNSKLQECNKQIDTFYNKEVAYIDKAYILKLSKYEQNKLYVEIQGKDFMLQQALYNSCVKYFNRSLDFYEYHLKYVNKYITEKYGKKIMLK